MIRVDTNATARVTATKNSTMLISLLNIYPGAEVTRYARFKIVRNASKIEEAVQIAPITAIVNKLCGGVAISSRILGFKASINRAHDDAIIISTNLLAKFSSPIVPIIAIKKNKNG